MTQPSSTMRTDCTCGTRQDSTGTWHTERCKHCTDGLQQLLTDTREERERKARLIRRMEDQIDDEAEIRRQDQQDRNLHEEVTLVTPKRSQTPVMGSPPKLKRQKRTGRLVDFCSLEHAANNWNVGDCDRYLLSHEAELNDDEAFVFEVLLPVYLTQRDEPEDLVDLTESASDRESESD